MIIKGLSGLAIAVFLLVCVSASAMIFSPNPLLDPLPIIRAGYQNVTVSINHTQQILNPVQDGLELRNFFLAARRTRVDVVGIGDSNQGYFLTGWDHGYQYALANQYPMYATGLISLNEARGWNTFLGYKYNRINNGQFGSIGSYTDAPEELSRYMNKGNATEYEELRQHNYAYLRDNETYTYSYLQGLVIDADCPLNVSADLRFHLVYGTFAEGNGSFRPLVRRDTSPQTILVRQNQPITPVTGHLGDLIDYTLDLPTAQRDYPLNFRFVPHNSNEVLEGPFFGTYYRAENLNRANGTSFSTLHFGGGYSAREMAVGLRNASDDYLSDFFGRVRSLQGEEKFVLVRINTGLNDRAEGYASATQRIMPGFSTEAFRDNVQTIMNRVREIWVLNNWNQSELYFMIVVSHDVPPEAPTFDRLDSYRPIARELAQANPQTAAVDLKMLAPRQVISANQWYANNNMEYPHLIQEGYEAIARLELNATLRAAGIR